jgi:predicted kinase
VLVGLPGAGKSTLYRSRFASTHALVSKDEMPTVRNRSARQRELIDRALGTGQSVVVDNTNPTAADRAPLIAQARAHNAAAVACYLETTTREALARNRGREGQAKVPPVAIFTCAKRLQAPTLDEGFDRIEILRPLDEGRFDTIRVEARA